jgi:hypothetical protein
MNKRLLRIISFIVVVTVAVLLLMEATRRDDMIDTSDLNLSFHYSNPKPVDASSATKIDINENDDYIIDISKISRCIDNNYFSVCTNSDTVTQPLYDLYDKNGTLVLDCDSESEIKCNEQIAIIQKDGLYGAMDLNGNWIISPRYHSMEYFNEGIAVVSTETTEGTTKYGYVNNQGTTIYPIELDEATSMLNQRAIISKDGIYNIINSQGMLLINNSNYTEMQFLNSYILAKNNSLSGILDYDGNPVTEFEYLSANITFSTNTLILQKENTSYGLMDISGKWLLNGKEFRNIQAIQLSDIDFDGNSIYLSNNAINFNNEKFSNLEKISQYDELYLVTTQDFYQGIVDNHGNYIISPDKYIFINYIADEFIVVAQRVFYGAIDIWGNPILDENHKAIFKVTNNSIAVKDKYNSIGIIDYNSVHNVESSYSEILGYGDGLITAVYRDDIYPNLDPMPEEGRKFYYIDEKGNVIINCDKATNVENFINGTAIIYYKDEYALINTNGEIILGNFSN